MSGRLPTDSSKTCSGQINRLAEGRTSAAATPFFDDFRWHECCQLEPVMLDIRW
jgi:hypothetical protein